MTELAAVEPARAGRHRHAAGRETRWSGGHCRAAYRTQRCRSGAAAVAGQAAPRPLSGGLAVVGHERNHPRRAPGNGCFRRTAPSGGRSWRTGAAGASAPRCPRPKRRSPRRTPPEWSGHSRLTFEELGLAFRKAELAAPAVRVGRGPLAAAERSSGHHWWGGRVSLSCRLPIGWLGALVHARNLEGNVCRGIATPQSDVVLVRCV